MNTLSRHIEILLLSNDCVIVPGLGGFVAHYQPARWDEGDATFLPPTRTLGFNPRVTLNDSVLVQSYIDAFDLSYPEAQRRLDDEVAAVRAELDDKGEYMFHNIGTLTRTDSQTLEFTPMESGILSPTLYGLGGFSFEKRQDQITKNIKKVEREDGEAVITIKVSTLRNVAVAASMFFAALLLGNPSGSDSQTASIGMSGMNSWAGTDTEWKLNELVEDIDVNREADEFINTMNGIFGGRQSKAEAKPAAPKKPAAPRKPVIRQSDYWCMVLGSGFDMDHARIFSEQMKGRGINTRIISEKKGCKVILGNFATKEEVYGDLSRRQTADPNFPSAWVYHVD